MYCQECVGKQICAHNKTRNRCKQCLENICHLCKVSPVVVCNGITMAYQWKEVFDGKELNTDSEIHNTLLASALEVKVDFTKQELDEFNEDFYYESYIKVGNKYYTPAGTCRKCHHYQLKDRGNGALRHLQWSLHKRGIVLKPLHKTGEKRTKEMQVKDTLDKNDIKYVNDITVIDRDSSCEKSANRPDFQVQHTHQELVTIYVEVDEDQHKKKSYDNTCELVRLNDIAISHQYRRPIVVLRYNPDPFIVGSHHITCKQLSRDDKEKILMLQLKNVMEAAAFPETFPPLLRVIKICYNCNCQTTTECGFVHVTDYQDQEAIRREYNLMR